MRLLSWGSIKPIWTCPTRRRWGFFLAEKLSPLHLHTFLNFVALNSV